MTELWVFSALAVAVILGGSLSARQIDRYLQRRRDREAVTRSLARIDRHAVQSMIDGLRDHESRREREIHG